MTDIEKIQNLSSMLKDESMSGRCHNCMTIGAIDDLLAALAEKDENTALLIKTNQKATNDLVQHKKEIAALKAEKAKEFFAAAKIVGEQKEEIAALKKALDAICHELGVPGEGYPAPVSNAVAIARAALSEGKP